MRAPVVIAVLSHLFSSGSVHADPTSDVAKFVETTAVHALKGCGGTDVLQQGSGSLARHRSEFAELPPEARGLRNVLLLGGQVSLAGGPLVLQVGREGTLKLVGRLSEQRSAASRVLRDGGTLAIDENKEVHIRDGRVAEVHVRDINTVHILIPRTDDTNRAVEVYRDAVPRAAATSRGPELPPREHRVAEVGQPHANSCEQPRDAASGPPTPPDASSLTRLRDDLNRIEAWMFSVWQDAEAVLQASHRAVVDQRAKP